VRLERELIEEMEAYGEEDSEGDMRRHTPLSTSGLTPERSLTSTAQPMHDRPRIRPRIRESGTGRRSYKPERPGNWLCPFVETVAHELGNCGTVAMWHNPHETPLGV
jgi:hypothetical protein